MEQLNFLDIGVSTEAVRVKRRVSWLPLILLVSCTPPDRSGPSSAGDRLPIIDMHMHSREANHYGAVGIPLCAPVARMPRWDQRSAPFEGSDDLPLCTDPLISPSTDADVLGETLVAMERFNVYGVLGGSPALVDRWMGAGNGRFIPSLDVRFEAETARPIAATASGKERVYLDLDSIRQYVATGRVKVLAEVMNQYAGIAPNDPRLEPLWTLAEALDVPVGVHMGGGGPAEPYVGSAQYRARFSSALFLEDVLVRHPRMRVYVMHGGYPLLDDLLALLFTHPQVYVELSMAANVETRASYHRYLRAIVEAGYGDRIMFGSDQMVWPGLIEAAIRSLESADFLSPTQKRDILYNNAARFLRLSDAEIARHHGSPSR